MKAFITRHPSATYFALTFAISWSGVVAVIGGLPGGTAASALDNPLFPFAVLAMLAGPSVAGILLTALIDGRTGRRKFRSRLLKWRVGAGWYAIALLAAPLLSIAALLTLSLLFPGFRPALLATDDKASLLLLGVSVGLAAGFFEELGWTGFAVPHLERRYSVLTTGLIVGVLWSAWHVLVVVWGIGNRAGSIPLALFVILDSLTILPAFRVLMVWVYDRTGSLLLGMVMHATLTASTLILWPVATGISLMIYDTAFATAVWLIVAAISHRSSLDVERLRTLTGISISR
jgi:CAAX protease family protein